MTGCPDHAELCAEADHVHRCDGNHRDNAHHCGICGHRWHKPAPEPIRQPCVNTGPHEPHNWWRDFPSGADRQYHCPGTVEVPTVADYAGSLISGKQWSQLEQPGAFYAPLNPIYGERQTVTTRYLTDDDRRNLHLLVHTERLTDLRRYAKTLIGVAEERRRMDPDRRPVADALPSFSFGRDVAPMLVEIKPAEYDELRRYIDTLTGQHNLGVIDDPYEVVYTSDADLAALYYFVDLVRNIIDRAGPPPAKPGRDKIVSPGFAAVDTSETPGA